MSFSIVKVVDKVNVEDVGENANGVDIQGIDTQSLKNRGERMPIENENAVEFDEVLSAVELRDSEKYEFFIPRNIFKEYKNYDFFITNSLDSDVRIAFSSDQFTTSVALEDDGGFSTYNTSTDRLHHVVEANSRYVKLSDVHAKVSGDGRKSASKAPFKDMYVRAESGMRIEYRAVDTPTSGSLRIYLRGERY